MNSGRPTVYLLTGLPGSGKSTYARRLEAKGVVRVSVDDEMLARHGRLGVDYPVECHIDLLGPVLDWATERVLAEVAIGASVVFDHGLGSRRDRDRYKRIVDAAGGEWRLLYFRAPSEVLLERLSNRLVSDAEAAPITPEMLKYLASVFEEPGDEGEELAT